MLTVRLLLRVATRGVGTGTHARTHVDPLAAAFIASVLLAHTVTAVAQTPTTTGPTPPGGDAVPSPGCDQVASTEVPTMLTVTSGGVEREALLHLPAPAQQSVPLPLVLAFHGYGAGPYDQEWLSGLSAKADSAGFIVAYPAGIGSPPQWDLAGDTDVTFAVELLTTLEARLCVDQRRVYATGFSMGGGMSNVLGCRLADRIAAIAPVSALHGETWGGECLPSRPVGVIAFHGVLDGAVPYEGGELVDFPEWAGRPASGVEAWAADWARLDGCAPEPDVTSVAGDVESLTWHGCLAPVQLYRITDGGHAWPGGINDPGTSSTNAISASDLMWAFFQQNPMPAP